MGASGGVNSRNFTQWGSDLCLPCSRGCGLDGKMVQKMHILEAQATETLQ